MKIISHRGAGFGHPDNTLPAFERAIESGVDAIEADVLQARDGRFILGHDWEAVSDAKISTLDQFMTRFFGRCPIMLDLKSPCMSGPLVAFLKKNRYLENIQLTSHLRGEILEMGRVCPEISRSIVLDVLPDPLEKFLTETGIQEVSLPRNIVSKNIMEHLKQNNLLVRVYTVNSREEADRFKSWGVDAIFTDNPASVR